jgi:glutathione synthase/RimK-type ligase-like ATP-grasp enzyme
MILVLSDRNDSHAKFVVQKIVEKGLPFFQFNVDVDSLLDTYVTFNEKWKIIQQAKELRIEDITCVWHRRTFVELMLEEESDQSNDFKIWKSEWNKTLLGIYSALRDVPWLNPWRNSYQAENKYIQMEVANSVGLTLPRTIVSNQKKDLNNFLLSNPSAVLKLMNQDFYKSQAGEYQGFYVNKITPVDMARFKISNENPIVLQAYIVKDYEVRYTVVGREHFVCKIESQKSDQANIDWRRYDIPNTPHSRIEPPESIKNKVDKLMDRLQIEYGALDFVVQPDGAWIFLEVNAMGQFLWIEDLTGLNISDEIVEWLENHLNLKKSSL